MKTKNLTLLFVLMLWAYLHQAWAQVPQGFNYQAVARNSVGVLLQNQALGVRLAIHQGSATGTVVYSERQTPTTNQFGLFTVIVGQGTVLSGTFNTILWSTGNYWLEVGLDVTGGTTYTSMGTSQLLSVPYAMYAANPGPTGATGPTGPTGATGAQGIQGVTGPLVAGTNGQTLRHDGSSWVATGNLYNDGTRIGIGMTPNYDVLLEVRGGSGQPWPKTHYTSAITGSTSTDGFTVGLDANDGVGLIWNAETQPIRFGTSANDRMILDAVGNLGIGTTTPTAQLHTTGTLRFEGAGSPAAGKVLTSDALGNATWQTGASLPVGATGNTLRHDGSNWVANSVLFNNGASIGIGTTTPGQKLDVNGNINAAGNVLAGGVNTTGQFTSSIATGTAPLVVTSTTKVNNLNADQLDGFTSGNASGNVPLSNGTVNTNLNADMVDGYHSTNLVKTLANGTVTGSNYVDIAVPSYYPFTLQLSCGHPYGYLSTKGGQAFIQGFINDSRVGLLITYSDGANYTGAPGTGTVLSTYKTADMASSVVLFTFGGTGSNLYTISTISTAGTLRISAAAGAIEVYYKLMY